jgi:hypothetical protein
VNVYDPAAGLDLPDYRDIEKAAATEDPMEATRLLYQLALRYRELAVEALESAKDAANRANAKGIPFGKVAGYAGAASSSSLSRTTRQGAARAARRTQ